MVEYRSIAIGFINATRAWVGVSSKETEYKAKVRYEICLGCPVMSESKTICDKDKGGCGCLLFLKVRQDIQPCPKGRWL